MVIFFVILYQQILLMNNVDLGNQMASVELFMQFFSQFRYIVFQSGLIEF